MHFHHIGSTTLLCILSVFFWSVALAAADVDTIEKKESLNDHLTRKLREARVTIAKEYTKLEDDTDSVITVSYDVKWEKIGSEVLNFSESRLVVRILDKMFIMEGNRTLSVNVKSVSNETSYVALLAQSPFLRQGRSVKLAKSIVWKSRLYLLVCEEDECALYIGENDSRLEHEQSLNHRGMFDATFFTRDNRLYLLVTHHKNDEFLGSSTIYHWTGTYMDIIQPIETVGDVLVTAFNYGRATIMVFGQPKSNIGLEIYEYYDNGIEKISYLPTSGPIALIHYRHDGFDFLLIVKKQEASSVYWWDGAGREFIHWFDLADIVSPSKVNVAQLDGDTFLFVSYESSVRLYKVSRPKYTRLDILDFKATGEKVIDMEVEIDENAKLLNLIVVTFDPSIDRHRIEPWKLYIKKNKKINAEIPAAVDKNVQLCLSELFVKLNDRMIAMENLTRNTWPRLMNSEANNTVTESFVLRKLILGSSDLQNSVKIGSIEVNTSGFDAELLFLPNKLEEALTTTSILVSTIVNDSRRMLKIHGDNTLTGNVTVQGDTNFVNVRTNSIRTSNFNGHKMKLENFSNAAITARENQIFTNSRLRGKNITVHRLTIDRLCGIPYRYWLRVEKAATDNFFSSHNLTDITMENDTVFLESKREVLTSSLRQLSSRSLDGLNIKDFLNNLFIPGKSQNIKGNIFQKTSAENTIRIGSLVAEELNGISAEKLLTINTDQNITGRVYFSAKMLWKSVVTKKINGIDIADFAMVSKNNYFKGELTVAKMRVSNRLVIENPKKFSLDPPVQIYNSVSIVGNARAKNIEFQSGAKSSPIPALLSYIKDRYWTKSTGQTIKKYVIFDKGLKVDELRVKLFNDLDPDKDILMTSAREIFARFNSLRLKNFTVKHFVRETAAATDFPPDRLYEDSPDSLTINQEIRIERLSVGRLYIENFNGIPVEKIMSGRIGNSEAFVYPESNLIQKFETVTVNDRLEMEHLHLTFVHETDGLKKNEEEKLRIIVNRFPRINDNYTIHSLKSDELFVGNLEIDNIAAINIRDFISQRNHCFPGEINDKANLDPEICSRLIIQGDALIKENLKVTTINEKSPMIYFDELATEIFHVNSNDTFVVNNLLVHKKVTVNLFRGVSFETLYNNTLSKSRHQHLGYSKMSFFQVFVEDLNTENINNFFTNDLIYIDSGEIKFESDVTFTNLKISSLDPRSMPEIRTKYLNEYSTLNNEIIEKLGSVSPRAINTLKVWGNVFWQESADEGSENIPKFEAISRYSLLRNKTVPIVIRTEDTDHAIIKSSNGVIVSRMKSKVKGTLRDRRGDTEIDIEKILQDCFVDGSAPLQPEKEEIRISGRKTFTKDVKIARFMVPGEMKIKHLNSWSIEDLNSSIVSINLSRDDNMFSTMNASMIFRKCIKVKKLVIFDSKKDLKIASSSLIVHGSSLNGIFTLSGLKDSDEFLPHSTYLEHLVVLDDARVKYLDSVDLDDFLNNRVSLHSNPETPLVVRGRNIQFNGLVKVSENAWAELINGIAPVNLVLNDILEKQIMSDEKTFVDGDLVVEGESFAPVVAGINFTDAYNNAVMNGNPIEIFGDIIFYSDVEKSSTKLGLENSTDIIVGTKDGFIGGFVNRISLKNVSSERDAMWKKFIFQFEEIKSELEARIARLSKVHSPEIFYYFEEENNLVISEAANVERVRVTKVGYGSILSLYTNDLGSSCGLANECFCRKQYVAEISSAGDDCRIWKVDSPHRIYHFHESNRTLAIKVATTTVSSDERCTFFERTTTSSYEAAISEFTIISWMGNQRDPWHTQIVKSDLKIFGYLSDAAIFSENGSIYIVLAIYYDPIISRHETNSFVYVLDVESNTLKLAQHMPTSYAVGVQVFHIPNKGHHIFFSSYADGKSTESVIYRLERHSTEFRLLRRFMSGGNRHVKSVARDEDHVLLLDDVKTKSINVYRYDPQLDDYQHHQSIFYDSGAPITSIETFYTGDFRASQAYVIVTTERDGFFVYKCAFMSKLEEMGRKKVDGIVSMVPFEVADRRYVFVGTDANSTIYRMVEQQQGIRKNRPSERK